MKIIRSLYLMLLFQVIPISMATSQVPTADYLGRWLSRTTSVVQQASQFIKQTAEPLVKTFRNVQQFFQKAYTAVKAVIQNMETVERIIDTHKDILQLYAQSIAVLNSPMDTDLDGVDDLDFLDKWKHAQILLALSTEATGAFELFNQLIEEDALTMDDSGRVQFLIETLRGLRKIKSAMRLQLRRINQEIYQYRRLEKEVEVFDNLFR